MKKYYYRQSTLQYEVVSLGSVVGRRRGRGDSPPYPLDLKYRPPMSHLFNNLALIRPYTLF